MSAGQYNITVEEGADYDIQMTWKDDSDTIINLTGYTGRMFLKDRIDGSTSVDWSTYLILGGLNGTITLNVPASATIDLGFRNGVYDIELENEAGKVYKLLRGRVAIIREVSN